MMRLTVEQNADLTLQADINAIEAACQALSDFQISYEQRFFYPNRDNTFAHENVVQTLLDLLHTFNEKNLNIIKNNSDLKRKLCLALKDITIKLSELEIENLRRNSDLGDSLSNEFLSDLEKPILEKFDELAQKKPNQILIKFRYLLPLANGSEAFEDGIVPAVWY